MKNLGLLLMGIICLNTSINGQVLLKPNSLKVDAPAAVKDKIYAALDSLFIQLQTERLDTNLINPEGKDLTISMLQEVAQFSYFKKDSLPNYYQKQLLNFHPISSNQYALKIAYISQQAATSTIRAIIHLIANSNEQGVQFSLPLKYLTRTWSSKKVGNINYIFKDHINIERAKIFNAKNTAIAHKLKQQPEQFTFYLSDNYQEILSLLGFEYDLEGNGVTRNGYGVDANTIFAIGHNEDFSHDIFHYYSGKVNAFSSRNFITEEGVAYSWGNAYWTDKEGEMIQQTRMVKALKKYLSENSNLSLLTLFQDKPKIFDDLAPEISTRSVIAGILCDEVEKRKGMDGLNQLITCGRKPDSLTAFFASLDQLIGINQANFDVRVYQLLENKL